MGILHQFAEHTTVCDVCKTRSGDGTIPYCDIGGLILAELTKFGDDVKEVPENWKPTK
jgi:hypothetical protein